jgi:DHA2 family multidrug resistance protein
MGLLRKQEIGNASGIYNLIRNIGGSIGIACITTMLVRNSQTHQNYLGANLTAGSPAAMGTLAGLQARFTTAGADGYTAHQEALGALYRSVQQQAAVLAYADIFRLLGYLSLLCIPLVLLLHRLRHNSRRPAEVSSE